MSDTTTHDLMNTSLIQAINKAIFLPMYHPFLRLVAA
jgi:hypothetical protein